MGNRWRYSQLGKQSKSSTATASKRTDAFGCFLFGLQRDGSWQRSHSTRDATFTKDPIAGEHGLVSFARLNTILPFFAHVVCKPLTGLIPMPYPDSSPNELNTSLTPQKPLLPSSIPKLPSYRRYVRL